MADRQENGRRQQIETPANGHYITLNGLATYYEMHGEGEPLLFLHGGTAPLELHHDQIEGLSPHFRLYLPERRGQGRTRDPGEITYALMVEDTAAFIEALDLAPVHVVGWSDGAIVGILLAIVRPDLVRKLVSISANFAVEGLSEWFVRWVQRTNASEWPPPIIELYNRISPDGPEHFPVVLEKIKRLWLTEPHLTPDDLARITAPTLVMAADRDIMELEHTIELYRSMPRAQLCIVPGTTHTLLSQKPEVVNKLIIDFLKEPAQ